MGIMYKIMMKHRNLNMDLNKSVTNTSNIVKSDHKRLITIEGDIIERPLAPVAKSSAQDDLTQNIDSSTNMDKQFTAEHIIQLCKFLAEKSKRNKNVYKQQQSPKKLTKSKKSEFTFQPMEYKDGDDKEVDFYQNEALPLLRKQKPEAQQQKQTDNNNDKDVEFEQQNTTAVLSTRLSPDINLLNISYKTTTAISCALQHQHQHQQHHINNYHRLQQQQHHQQQPQELQTQGKRDILLKIRRQIFERKRLRENGAFEQQAFNNSQVWRPW